MSSTRYTEQAEVDLSVIRAYLSHYGVKPEQEQAFINTIKSYGRNQIYVAFAKQAEALARIEEEYYLEENK